MILTPFISKTLTSCYPNFLSIKQNLLEIILLEKIKSIFCSAKIASLNDMFRLSFFSSSKPCPLEDQLSNLHLDCQQSPQFQPCLNLSFSNVLPLHFMWLYHLDLKLPTLFFSSFAEVLCFLNRYIQQNIPILERNSSLLSLSSRSSDI